MLTDEHDRTLCNELNELNICTVNTDFQDVIDNLLNFAEPFPSAVKGMATFV